MSLAQKYKTVKGYAVVLILQSVRIDADGRHVGHSYKEIIKRLKRAFPVITYNGPHKGKPIRMTVKQLREIAYTMQSEDRSLRLPVRPRSDRRTLGGKKRKPGTSATITRQKVEHAKPGIPAP